MVDKGREEYVSSLSQSRCGGGCPLHSGVLKPGIGTYDSFICWAREKTRKGVSKTKVPQTLPCYLKAPQGQVACFEERVRKSLVLPGSPHLFVSSFEALPISWEGSEWTAVGAGKAFSTKCTLVLGFISSESRWLYIPLG